MKLYVGNMSWDTTEEELTEAFAQFGTVVSTNIIVDRDTGRRKGFGFVEMSSKTEGEAAINELNESLLGGRNIKVNEARPRVQRQFVSVLRQTE